MAVKASAHRVERAIVNSGFMRPQDRIVINLAPAELPKQAASFDLPITLGMLAGSGQVSTSTQKRKTPPDRSLNLESFCFPQLDRFDFGDEPYGVVS
jgi:hypothetical protein